MVPDPFDFSSLVSAIEDRTLQITVVGLGKMGLPIALVFTHANFVVTGYDIDKQTVETLNQGKTILTDEAGVQDRLKVAVQTKKFRATIDPRQAMANADVVIIIIPVMDDNDGNQDLNILLETYTKLRTHAKQGVIFIQESTLAPGTTSNQIKSALETEGWKSGKDFGLVFAPERTFSGRVIKDIEENYPKLIGGDTTNAAEVAAKLYETVANKGVIQLANATTAEAVKTFKGAYRDANIAIANQFAILADLYGVDVKEVIQAANTEPFSNIHTPGIGVGGHCIPVYPMFVISGGVSLGYTPDVLVTSRKANLFMTEYAIQVLDEHVKKWSDTLVLGLAYRGGVKEFRNSPTLNLVSQLQKKGINVKVADPLFSPQEVNDLFESEVGIEWHPEILKNYRIIIIATDHDQFKNIEENFVGKIIYDGRYVVNRKELDDLAISLNKQTVLLQPGRLIYNKNH